MAIISLGLLSAATLFSGCATGKYGSRSKGGNAAAREYNEQGVSKFSKDDFDGAISNFDQAIALNPNYVLAYCNRGGAKTRKGDMDAALADYDRALEIDPRFYEAYQGRGEAKNIKSDPDGAIADFSRALEIKPKYYDAYKGRGETKQSKGDLDGAIVDFDRALEIHPYDDATYKRRGDAKVAKGDVNGGIADFDCALELNHTFAAACKSRSDARRVMGDTKGANEDHARAAALDIIANASSKDRSDQDYPLHQYILSGNTKSALEFIDTATDVDAMDQYGCTALIYAADEGNLPVVRALVEKGANVNGPDHFGFFPLRMAALSGNKAVLEFLIERGADVNHGSPLGTTPLMAAAGAANPDICVSLLNHGAEFQVASLDHQTALGEALKSESSNTVITAKLLIDAGASLSVTTNSTVETYFAGVYLKLLGDKQWNEGLTAEAKRNYLAAKGYLTDARDRLFVENIRWYEQTASRGGFWNAMLQEMAGAAIQGMAEGLAGAAMGSLGSVNQYNSYRQMSQMYALRHAKTPGEYFSMVDTARKNYRPLSALPVGYTGLTTPRNTGGAKSVQAYPLPFAITTCDQLLGEIERTMTPSK
jgi:tetratricopeptide (TPR) repeat protein